MDFEEYAQANWKRLEGQTREFVEDAFKAGQQSKQAQINRALELLRQPMQGTVADLLNELEDILDDT